MKLVFLPVNNAWAFLFGDAPLRIEGEALFFESKKEARRAAEAHGLRVEPNGNVVVAVTK